MRADVVALYDSFASDMVLRFVTDVFSNPVEEHTLPLYHHAALLAYRFFLLGLVSIELLSCCSFAHLVTFPLLPIRFYLLFSFLFLSLLLYVPILFHMLLLRSSFFDFQFSCCFYPACICVLPLEGVLPFHLDANGVDREQSILLYLIYFFHFQLSHNHGHTGTV